MPKGCIVCLTKPILIICHQFMFYFFTVKIVAYSTDDSSDCAILIKSAFVREPSGRQNFDATWVFFTPTGTNDFDSPAERLFDIEK